MSKKTNNASVGTKNNKRSFLFRVAAYYLIHLFTYFHNLFMHLFNFGLKCFHRSVKLKPSVYHIWPPGGAVRSPLSPFCKGGIRFLKDNLINSNNKKLDELKGKWSGFKRLLWFVFLPDSLGRHIKTDCLFLFILLILLFSYQVGDLKWLSLFCSLCWRKPHKSKLALFGRVENSREASLHPTQLEGLLPKTWN